VTMYKLTGQYIVIGLTRVIVVVL